MNGGTWVNIACNGANPPRTSIRSATVGASVAGGWTAGEALGDAEAPRARTPARIAVAITLGAMWFGFAENDIVHGILPKPDGRDKGRCPSDTRIH